ncbi:hypothetical protein KQ51_00597 [Candidatus Izimaplasma bacterium HR1]|jgi:hypothetical protein|uniref:hypothetical protein n=1 Tax=Candidatus Izimoplasma sp. HR1 TaxID=1541959 RepID=UPI0004F8CF2B|nr:hypothetical protein KQ51_00597 [Candidatus Izimaplasma bacterium HR1]
MSLHRNAKNAKIIEEIYVYLLDRGYHKVSVLLEALENESIFHIEIYTDNSSLVEELKEDIVCGRDAGLEEYGWELMGESDHVLDLYTLGTLLDSCEISYDEGICRVVFVREEV